MKSFVLSALSILLTVSALAPVAQAAEANSEKFSEKASEKSSSLHRLRLDSLDQRNKSWDVNSDKTLQRRRLDSLDQRNKVGDKLSTTPLLDQRH
jgi:hypothetical protein